ncbi:MAG: hypothetical protein KJ731_03805, partial [Alphaproteobacteria bacterium]|nr:hypothetical protein [Alphaproteobacteria bacterium]MBU1827592.1 hypothetical protein [Alphaproteobacteria bacterium]
MTHRAGFSLSALTAIGLILGVGLFNPSPVSADAGAYLAARQATMDRSFRDLVSYATRSLASDPQNPVLLESVISGHISMGNFDQIKGYTTVLRDLEPGNQIAAMGTLTRLARDEDYDGVIATLD